MIQIHFSWTTGRYDITTDRRLYKSRDYQSASRLCKAFGLSRNVLLLAQGCGLFGSPFTIR